MKFVIAGGSGALGRRLADRFAADGDDVVILTRRPHPEIPHRQRTWDGRQVGDWASELDGAVVVNLAGELVDRRPTRRNIELLRQSRVEPTRALVAASAAGATPTLWLQMSTLAIYGDAGQTIIDESHPAADGPPQMAGVAAAWEAAVVDAVTRRLVIMRTGIVFDRDTPAFDRLTTVARWGVGGRISHGDQWISWLHADDFVRAVRFLTQQPALDGIVHLTAPNPVQNRELMNELRAALHRPWAPPTPAPLVRIGAFLMRTDPALALTGRRCRPRRLADAGFTFEHPTVTNAIEELIPSR